MKSISLIMNKELNSVNFILIVFVVFLGNTMVVNSQDFQVILRYDIILEPKAFGLDFNDPDISLKEKNERQDSFNKLKKIYEKSFVMYLTDSESLYIEDKRLILNSREIGNEIDYSITYYKNLKKNVFIEKRDTPRGKYLINDTIINFIWELHPETKIIGGFLCYKASFAKQETLEVPKKTPDGGFEIVKKINEFKVVAWYTPDIPISNGPDDKGGLPGLILEVEYGNKSKTQCVEIVINPQKFVFIKPPKGGKTLTLEEYEKLTGHYRQ